jgi:hypothetical protein
MARIAKPKTSGAVPPRATQIKEIMKCGEDPAYFIKNYVKIAHPIRGPLPFDTYPYQDMCLDAFQKNRFVITNKSRQLGLSTLSAAYSVWMAIFQRDKNILCIATRLEVAKNFLKKVNLMYESLPKWLVMPAVKAQSVKYIEFSNGSKIQAVPSGKDAGRSESLSLLIVDEAAHVENIDELWLGLRPALGTGGSAILISSPSGVGTLFHKLWVGAKEGIDGKGADYPGEGTNDFYRIELPWTVHPEHDQEWYEKEAAEIRPAKGESGVNMELNCQFVSSGEGFITQEVFDRLDSWISLPIASYGKGGNLWIWKYAVPGHRYLIPIDCARGDAKDFSAFHVIDIDADEVIAEFQAKISPEDLADFVAEIGLRYNTATLCPELNSYGLITASKLKSLKYPKLYYEKFAKNVYSVYNEFDVIDELPGLTTGPKNRDEMMAKLENILRTGAVRVYSKRLVDELRTFVWKGSKAQAMKGYNDDLVMSLAIGLHLFDASGTEIHDGQEMAMAMLAAMGKSTKTLAGNNQGAWASEQNYMPPIITSNNIKDVTAKQDLIVKKEQGSQGPQDFSNPWYNNWRWVLD